MKIISVATQKGGVGKTTTVINLAASLAEEGKRVLMIDCDPQSSLTKYAGINPQDVREKNIYKVLIGNVNLKDILIQINKYYLAPSFLSLAAAEQELNSRVGKDFVLRNKLMTLKDYFDYIIIDCPPSLGNITINALVASDGIIIPVECEYLAYEGLNDITYTIKQVQEMKNDVGLKLDVFGLVISNYDSSFKQQRDFLDMFLDGNSDHYPVLYGDYEDENNNSVKKPIIIKRSALIANSSLEGSDIISYINKEENKQFKKTFKGIDDYKALAKEVISICQELKIN